MAELTGDARIRDLKRRLELDPGSRLFVTLAEEYRKSGLVAEALSTLQKGLLAHPTYLSAQVALGRAYLEAGQITEAIATFNKVLSNDPEPRLREVSRRHLPFAGRERRGHQEVQALSRAPATGPWTRSSRGFRSSSRRPSRPRDGASPAAPRRFSRSGRSVQSDLAKLRFGAQPRTRASEIGESTSSIAPLSFEARRFHRSPAASRGEPIGVLSRDNTPNHPQTSVHGPRLRRRRRPPSRVRRRPGWRPPPRSRNRSRCPPPRWPNHTRRPRRSGRARRPPGKRHLLHRRRSLRASAAAGRAGSVDRASGFLLASGTALGTRRDRGRRRRGRRLRRRDSPGQPGRRDDTRVPPRGRVLRVDERERAAGRILPDQGAGVRLERLGRGGERGAGRADSRRSLLRAGPLSEALDLYDDLVLANPFDTELKRLRRDAEARLLPASNEAGGADVDPALTRRLDRVRALKRWLSVVQAG